MGRQVSLLEVIAERQRAAAPTPLDQAIERLAVFPLQKRILQQLAIRDRSLQDLAGTLERSARTLKAELRALERRGLVAPVPGWNDGWGLSPHWIAGLGVGDGLPPAVQAAIGGG